MLSNNDILKKLRVAHKLRDEDIIEILKLVDFNISKGALGDMFRSPDHPTSLATRWLPRHELNPWIDFTRALV